MNRVGFEGQGESVWLAWFLIDLPPLFRSIAESRNDKPRSMRYREQADQLSWPSSKIAGTGPGTFAPFMTMARRSDPLGIASARSIRSHNRGE